MRKILATTFIIMFLSLSFAIAQDNIYGDYYISSIDNTVSLDLEDARLVDVLKMLSQQSGLNFISTEVIKDRQLTLYLEDVPLKEAMDIVFKANNLSYDFYPDSNIFVIKEMGVPGLEIRTKVYNLKYVRVSSSRMQSEIDSLLAESGSDEGGSGGGTEDEEGEGIKGAVESVLSEFGKVTEDGITNSLIVVDVPAQFVMIDEVISKLDIPCTKVMIEVEMLDVSKTHLDKIGFNYANGLYASFGAGARSTHFPFAERFLKNPTTQTTAGDLTPPVLGILDLTQFTAVMQFLTSDTTTKFIARPKILTVANEVAEVNLTTNEAIGVTTSITDGGTSTQDVEREETGTKLRVVPQVNMDTREITLAMEMFNRESVDSGISITGLSSGSTLKNVEERGTKSVVRLKDGETLYIGGLIRKEENETVTKIPWLGDLPFIGALFRYTERPAADNQDRELLVFLTPRIIGEGLALAKKPRVLKREQVDTSRKKAVRVVLDKFTR